MINLNLGCGKAIIPGYINIDARHLPGVNVVENIGSLHSINDNSADLIYVSHVLEHFGRHEYSDVLKVWHQKLKPSGTLRIAVPDIERVMIHYLQNRDLKQLRGFLWGGQTYENNYHYMGWDYESLKADLESVGFINVRRYAWENTDHAGIDDFSQSYLPHMDKEKGILMSLNVEANKK